MSDKDTVLANAHQVGGSHYASKIQHWDYVAANGLDYFQGQITKYVERWKKKNGIQDLEKARHFLDKYIELEKHKAEDCRPTNVKDHPKVDYIEPIQGGVSLAEAKMAHNDLRDAPNYANEGEVPIIGRDKAFHRRERT